MSSPIQNVRVEKVTKMYGAVRALTNISFEMKAGEVVAVMGRNGAGKTTLMSMLSLAMRPTRGTVLFNGTPARDQLPEIYKSVGLLSHLGLVYPDLNGRENLLLFARLMGVTDPNERVRELEATLGITEFATDRPTRVLSRGQLQRVALARALVSRPSLLLLDEPAAGLDRTAVKRINTVVNDLTDRGGMAVIITHEVEVAAAVATRAVMIRGGRISADTPSPGSIDGWKSLYEDAVEGGGA